MTGCDFTVSGGNNGVMLYQSMSGDAADKDATASTSTLTMSGTTIRNNTDGAMFYITNTTSVIELNGGNTLRWSLQTDSSLMRQQAAGAATAQTAETSR